MTTSSPDRTAPQRPKADPAPHTPPAQSRSITDVWRRYSGADIPATIGGLMAAIGTFIFLGGLIAAGAGNIAYQVGVLDADGNAAELSLAGAITAIAVLFVSFFVGGWAAARMARFDGPRNGLIVALWMTVLVVVFGALGIWAGAEYNAFARLGLPDWVSTWDNGDVTLATSLLASAAALVTYAGAYLGGIVGDIYNTRVNSALASARPEPVLNR